MAAVRKDVAARSPRDISFGLCSEAGKTATVKSDVTKICKVHKATGSIKDDHLTNTKKKRSDGSLDDSSQKKRNIRYDSADSSDSGVGGESLVWSPCSSLLSYSPPPLLSDLEDDIPAEGIIHLPCPPPSPPQSSPSSPTDHDSSSPCHVTLMAPNDASGGIRVGRKGPNSDRLIGRCTRVMPVDPIEVSTTHLLYDDVNTLHKDRPPDPLSSPRTRRTLNASSSNRSPKKRGVDGGPDADRRLKACRAYANGDSEAIPLEGGQVTTEPGLLARLSGLSGENIIKVGRSSPRSKGFSRKGFREDKGRSLWRSEDEISKLKEAKQQLLSNLNNNHSSRNNNLSKESERRNLSQYSQSSFPTSLTSSLTEPSPSLTPVFSNSSSSSSSTSGLGSSRNEDLSTPNSGTSTPTLSSVAPSPQVLKSSPKVRFPAPEKKESGEKDVCRWHNCGTNLDQSSSLLEHIQAVHVEGQLEAESFRCLWVGCKVFDRASCSVSWLERHVLTHGGQKPFKCIVDGCGLRFRSQTALGRHVNHHFSSPTAAPAPRVPSHTSPTKLIRKNGRKLRYRKRPWSARAFDFFDLSTMEKVRWGLYCASEVQSKSAVKVPCDHISFKSEVLCQRTNNSGEKEVLVRWSPYDILPNEWVNSDDFVNTRCVAFHKLSYEGQIVASKLLHPSLKSPSATNIRKRGPLRKPTSLFGYAEAVNRVDPSPATSSEALRNKSISSIARELFTKNGKLNGLVD